MVILYADAKFKKMASLKEMATIGSNILTHEYNWAH